MLGRRDFLKLLGLAGGALALPQVPELTPPKPELVVPPAPRVYQLDQTMLVPERRVIRVKEFSRGFGGLYIGGERVGNLLSWSLDQHADYAFNGLLYRRQVSEGSLQLDPRNLNLRQVLNAYAAGAPVQVRMSAGNRVEYTMEAWITDYQLGPSGLELITKTVRYGN